VHFSDILTPHPTKMIKSVKYSILILLTFFVYVSYVNANDRAKRVYEIAVERTIPSGAPQYSDVCFSSRWQRPMNDSDPYDTFRDAASFFATRLDWVYSTNSDWIREAKARGFDYGGAVSTIMTDAPNVSTRLLGRLKDRDGNFVARTRWAQTEVWEGCVNHPGYRSAFLSFLKIKADAGADYIVMDDPDSNLNGIQFGACWCEACRDGARQQGMDLSVDMLDFQLLSVRRFFEDMRRELDAYAGRTISWASNNYQGSWHFPYHLFDFGIAEIDNVTPLKLVQGMEAAQQMNKAQVYIFRSDDNADYRRVIAGTYATGQHMMVPWDQWMGMTDGVRIPRYFADPADFADLYGFVRGIATYLDGYEDAAYWGRQLRDQRYGFRWYHRPPITLSGGSGEIYAFTRAKPGDAAAPIVIHLVDWSDDSQPFRTVLQPMRLFPDQPVKISLLTPVKYDEILHQGVIENQDFSLLVKREILLAEAINQKESENQTSVETDVGGEIVDPRRRINLDIPALQPWGVLVIEPLPVVR
jgi:hypothetical protein